MKKIALVIFLATLLTGNAFAQLDPDDDGIGVYFDPCACVNCLALDQGEHLGYVVITHPSSPGGIGGWEAQIYAEGGGTLVNIELMGDAINVGSGDEYIVGLGSPLTNEYSFPTVVVGIVHLFVQNMDPINIYIDGVYNHSLPDRQPAYLDGDDYNTIRGLQQSTGGPDFPVATINGECAVASEPATFDGVKALYR